MLLLNQVIKYTVKVATTPYPIAAHIIKLAPCYGDTLKLYYAGTDIKRGNIAE